MINKEKIIRRTYEEVNKTRRKRNEHIKIDDVKDIVNIFLQEIVRALVVEKEVVSLRYLGKFYQKKIKGREYFNVITGKKEFHSSRNKIRFQLSEKYEDILNIEDEERNVEKS